MAPMTPGRASGFLILAGAELCLLATGAYSVTPQARTPVHPSPPSSHTRPIKRTWRTGPASMPLDTEVVPPHPSLCAPDRKAPNAQRAGRTESKDGERSREEALCRFDSCCAAHASAAAFKPEVTTIDESRHYSDYVDPEKRARDEMTRLRTNPGARQAFYEDLRHTVEQVRTGENDGNETKPAASRP